MLKIFIIQSLVIFLYASAWFIIAVLKNRNDVADIAWGGGFICAALTAYLIKGVTGARGWLVFSLVIIWGLRLILHISIRNRGKPEDRRYKAWRQEWGSNYLLRSFLQVFLLQGFLLLVISLPVTRTIIQSGPPLTAFDGVGFIIWLCGIFFEAIGDFQLLKFTKNPVNKGRIIQSGLWQYSRHPNYFGEVTLWWGIFLICLSGTGSWWTIIGPLTITYLILKVSGTPMLERRYAGNPEYAAYIRRTSAFFPLPPKNKGD